MRSRSPLPFALKFLAVAFLASLAACGPSVDPRHPARTPLADQWYARASESYRAGDFDDATVSAKSALQAAPSDPEIRTLAGRIALCRLEYHEALKLTEGLQTTDVHGIRGRAYWYGGDIEQAADELEAMLQDPAVKDPWAHDIAALARRGQGRHPFAMEGALVAVVEMPKAGPALIVPVELEGENILALVATASGEVVIDSSSRREAAWVNLRFADRIEVKDVPALAQDLSGVSRQLGAPIKALLGSNLLRHIHATFDRRGDQFVVRREDPAPPPDASRLPLAYIRGGGMLARVGLAGKDAGLTPMLVDSAALFPMALGDAEWKKAGVDLASLHPDPNANNMKTGTVPAIKLGAFDLPKVPAVEGASLADVRANVDIDVGGIVGAGLLYLFRVTMGEDGRFAWLEPDPTLLQDSSAVRPSPPPPSDAVTPPPPARPGPAESSAPKAAAPAPAKPATPAKPPPARKGTP